MPTTDGNLSTNFDLKILNKERKGGKNRNNDEMTHKTKNDQNKSLDKYLCNLNSDTLFGKNKYDVQNITMDKSKGFHKVSFFPQWGLYEMCHVCEKHEHNSAEPIQNDSCFYTGTGQFCPQRRGSCAVHCGSPPNNSRYRGDYCQALGSHGYECGCRLTNILAMNALDLTAPASDALLKNRKNAWVQLAGHPGSFAPAGPHTIWKKRLSKENTETMVYQQLMKDVVKDLVPKFYREVEYNGDFFIEMQDLLQQFTDPNVLDVKLGTRTFQESEVKNPVLRKDLYEKMIKIDAGEPTAEEHEQKAITKLRYMQYREQGSSTASLGFRCDAIRMSGQQPITTLQKVKTKLEVQRTFATFLKKNEVVKDVLIKRLKDIRRKFEASQFFKNHEIIGSSLLILYDKDNKAGVWMIDFAKTILVEGKTLTHRSPWQIGNHEDGFLFGIDSIIEVLQDLDFNKLSDSISDVNQLNNLTISSSINSEQSCPKETTPTTQTKLPSKSNEQNFHTSEDVKQNIKATNS